MIATVQRFGASATNWLMGISHLAADSNGIGLALDLINKLWLHTFEKHKNNTLVPLSHAKDNIYQVSLASRDREGQVEEYLRLRDSRIALVEFVDDKMDAAIILVNSMYNKCRNGYLDTKALGELINSELMMSLLPENTILRSITHDPKKKLLDISYEIVTEIALLDRINYGALSILIMLLGLLSLLGYTFKVLKGKLEQIDKVQERQERSLSVSLSTLRRGTVAEDGFEFQSPPSPVSVVETCNESLNMTSVSNSGGRVGNESAAARASVVSRVYS
jgi:hypothetical protein